MVVTGIIIIWTMALLPAGAQNNSGAIEIEPGGRLWIEGSASVVDYTCQAEELSGNGSIQNTETPQQNLGEEGEVSIVVSIPVHSLECGKKKMNRDMYEALKADNFKTIRYRLLEAEMLEGFGADSASGEWMRIRTRGLLEIAGVVDTTEVPVNGMLLGKDRFRVKGAKQIDMKTFDITPPTALFGLIKADNKLTVRFDVTVRLITR